MPRYTPRSSPGSSTGQRDEAKKQSTMLRQIPAYHVCDTPAEIDKIITVSRLLRWNMYKASDSLPAADSSTLLQISSIARLVRA